MQFVYRSIIILSSCPIFVSWMLLFSFLFISYLLMLFFIIVHCRLFFVGPSSSVLSPTTVGPLHHSLRAQRPIHQVLMQPSRLQACPPGPLLCMRQVPHTRPKLHGSTSAMHTSLLIPLKSRLYLLDSTKSCPSPLFLFTVLQSFLRNEKQKRKPITKKERKKLV